MEWLGGEQGGISYEKKSKAGPRGRGSSLWIGGKPHLSKLPWNVYDRSTFEGEGGKGEGRRTVRVLWDEGRNRVGELDRSAGRGDVSASIPVEKVCCPCSGQKGVRVVRADARVKQVAVRLRRVRMGGRVLGESVGKYLGHAQMGRSRIASGERRNKWESCGEWVPGGGGEEGLVSYVVCVGWSCGAVRLPTIWARGAVVCSHET